MNDIEMVEAKAFQAPQNPLINNTQNPYGNSNPYQVQPSHPLAFVQTLQTNSYTIPLEQDIRSSFAADRNQLQPVRCSIHSRSLFATIILFGGIAAAVCITIFIPSALSIAEVIGLPIASYVMYLLLACICNDLYSYLKTIQHGQHFQPQYNKIRKLGGKFKFWAQCYHYKDHVNSEGEIEERKVVTHTDTEFIVPKITQDISGQIDRIRAQKQIVFIQFIPNYRFKTEQCRRKFDQLYLRFQRRNKKDRYQKYTLQYIIPGLVQKQSFYVGKINCKYLQWFYIFGSLGFIWPFSTWVQSKVQRFNANLTKLITL